MAAGENDEPLRENQAVIALRYRGERVRRRPEFGYSLPMTAWPMKRAKPSAKRKTCVPAAWGRYARTGGAMQMPESANKTMEAQPMTYVSVRAPDA